MSKIPDNFDVRVLERNLRRGLITQEEIDKYLKSLPDSSANVVPLFPERSRRGAERSEGKAED